MSITWKGRRHRTVSHTYTLPTPLIHRSTLCSLTTRLGALNNLGNLYRDCNLHGLAEKSFMDGFILSSNTSALALTNLFIARRTLNKWEGAEEMTENIIRLTGEEMDRKRVLREGNFHMTSEEKQALSHAPPLMPYDSLLLSSTPPSFRLLIASNNSWPYESVQRLNKLNDELAPGNKITVSYLSYDFRDHPMCHLTRALVLGHKKDIFKTVLLSYGLNDNSVHRKR